MLFRLQIYEKKMFFVLNLKKYLWERKFNENSMRMTCKIHLHKHTEKGV